MTAQTNQAHAMQEPEVARYTVLEHFLPTLINGDTPDNPDDQRAIDTLREMAQRDCPDGMTFKYWSSTDERDEFGRCDVTGLRGEVVVVNPIYFPQHQP